MKNIYLTFRKLKKNKTVNILGISGLVVGLVCVMYIFLWVTNEVQYDRFHEKLDKIFVVHAYLEGGKEKVNFNGCPPAVAPALKDEYPEVIETCRYIPPFFEYLVSYGDQKFIEKTAMSEFSLFDIFSFPFLYGNTGESNDPNRIILTEEVSRKYFGNANPIGEIVSLDNKLNMTVVGVLKDIPENSFFNFKAIIPIENIGMYYARNDFLTTWYNNSYITFGLLNNPMDFDKIASNVTNRIQKELPNSTNYLRAYKFENQYLYEQNNIQKVRIFALIAFLVLLSATLNFINLSTARSSKQAKETGLRKTIGASRKNIIKLIYSDVAIVCLMAFVLAIFIVLTGLPIFNGAIGKNIRFSSLFSLIPVAVLLGIYLFTVFISGSYPAFFLSSFTPVKTLSSNYQTKKKRGVFRNSLVVVIFIVSIILLSSTFVITKQAQYLQKMDLGFERDQLMYVQLKGKLKKNASVLKEEINRNPNIISSSFVSSLPTSIGNNGEGWSWAGKDPEFKPLVTSWSVDHNMLNTFGATMAEGEIFRENQQGILINKTMANLIGWDSFEGETINNGENQNTILGVINDIHFNMLSEAKKPMAIYPLNAEGRFNNFLVMKVNTASITNTIEHIREVCQKIEPAFPHKYSFLDDDYNRILKAEFNLKKLIGIFSVFAILVLGLGLLGLVLFLTEQKTKEIGIRKTLGESVLSICGRFIKPFLISGLIAGLIGIPITWYAMDRWLQNYANHIDLNIWIFMSSVMMAITIAIFTVLWQSWRAATRNPVEALRYE